MKRIVLLALFITNFCLIPTMTLAEITQQLNIAKGNNRIIISLGKKTSINPSLSANYLYRICVTRVKGNGSFNLLKQEAAGVVLLVTRKAPGCFHFLATEGDTILAGTAADEVDANFRLICIDNANSRALCFK